LHIKDVKYCFLNKAVWIFHRLESKMLVFKIKASNA
jgi:hypothetical protein